MCGIGRREDPMTARHWPRFALTILCALAAAPAASAQPYPNRPVTLITSVPAGNGPDVIARIVADGLSRRWKQRVIVEDRPGGRAIVATLAAKRAAPDGYTLYVALGSTFVILPEIHHNLPFDLDRDLAPVGIVGAQPFVIAISPKLGVNTLGELVALSKKRPDEIVYGCFRGSAPHVAFELMQAELGARLKFIPYSKTTRMVADVLNGTIAVAIESLPALAGPIASGRLKALAVTSTARLPELPHVPTVAETLPGYEATGWFALMAPAGTPAAIVDQVNADLGAVLKSSETRKRFAVLGTFAMVRSPAEVKQFIARQHTLWKPIIHRMDLAN
jgi:tripartite-type tricarboxylate transporter receptor subunit TctC